MNSKLISTAIALLVLAVVIAVSTTGVFTPPPIPGSQDVLRGAERIRLAGAVGPESLVFDPSGGGPYTGVADGRILKWDGGEWVEFAVTSPQRESCSLPFDPAMEHICGRPLGLRFHHKTGDLYIADAYLGLQVVGPDGGMASKLVTEVEGRLLRFTNDLDIDEEKNVIYFTESSTDFYRRDGCKGPHDHTQLEHICGRPLGLRFNERTGKLYIADAYMGLLVVGPNGGQASPVATELDGVAFGFTNALDIDQSSGVVYFTDSSTRFTRRNYVSVVINGDNTGRLMKFEPKTNKTTLLVGNLKFPNGVALSRNGDFLLFVETTTCRLFKLWLKGPKVGKLEVVAQFPGFPDNLKRNINGEFWVGINSKRGRMLEWLISTPWIGNFVVRVSPIDATKLHWHFARLSGHFGMGIRLDRDGNVMEVSNGGNEKRWKFVSEVEEAKGSLWIGSVTNSFVVEEKIS